MQFRRSNLGKIEERVFDVLIIGGGINGAVSASALTTLGASVALVDRGDFAGETSQQSSNLIWGGIKYLESLEFGLVRKLCRSRNRLLEAYPSSAREIRFFTTIDPGFRHHRLTLYAGTWLYWAMGNFAMQRPRLLSAQRMRREQPLVCADRSAGGIEYSDAYLVDNDARFVFNFVRETLNHGGIVTNYVESLGSRRDGAGVWVTRARDRIDGHELVIRSRVLINACGPLVDAHNELSGVRTQHRHVYSKGAHLIVDALAEERKVLSFFADDGRLFFVIPMGPKSCIGTTDSRVQGLPAHVDPEDRRFILDNINKRLALPRPLDENDIIAERCGVRPLVGDKGEHARDRGDWTSLSRKHVIESEPDTGHISIFGGKLTDCLNIGNEVANLVGSLGVSLPYRGRRWYGEPQAPVRDEFFHQARLMGLDDMTSPDSSEPLSTRLWRRYLARALGLLEDIRQDPAMAEVLIKGTEYIRCEIHHAARHEMVTKLEDFLRRRSKIALIARRRAMRQAPGLREACRILFGAEAEAKFLEYFQD